MHNFIILKVISRKLFFASDNVGVQQSAQKTNSVLKVKSIYMFTEFQMVFHCPGKL